MRTHATREIALLRKPKAMAETLRTPQMVEWLDAIKKAKSSPVDKEVYEVRIRKLSVCRRLIPTKLVLIKLASDGSMDKYKARCVVVGYRQIAGLYYDPEGVYSPMAEPTALRLVLAIFSALKLNIDHLDIKTAFLNGEILENEQFFYSPPHGFQSARWYGMAHQERPVRSTSIRSHMGEDLPRLDAQELPPICRSWKRTMRLRDARIRRACTHQP